MGPLKNRGMFLETLLDITHSKYEFDNDCLVSKIPTNIKAIDTNNSQITKANFFASTNCDYIGVYKGVYFEFDAKETYKDHFDFHSVRKNQIEKLNLVSKNKGISFLIIYFGEKEEFFLVDFKLLYNWAMKNKKTIHFEWFIDNAHQIYIDNELKLNYLPKLNFLIN